jgi:hypothetical protein
MLACARADFEEFRDKVKTNLKAGKVRLVLIADKIPPESYIPVV